MVLRMIKISMDMSVTDILLASGNCCMLGLLLQALVINDCKIAPYEVHIFVIHSTD
jgi:hypothetical protein